MLQMLRAARLVDAKFLAIVQRRSAAPLAKRNGPGCPAHGEDQDVANIELAQQGASLRAS
eukprot:CAMPEP_0119375866 /NCGR_PEP_ID=MMETSP1334-20130426/37013_1 /TAXON_ID=127549 /ORGANISM="Calcidiscus leptoporus, Strain RCC1130" /LENGTH=59 /DNA_ID=CAMNT_0007394275 /DNA_START=450 /DNA_END=626 /DNA_ORIENTATION=+